MSELNSHVLAESQAIMKHKFPTMVQYFLEDTIGYMDSITEGIVEKNVEKIALPAHTIKSSSLLFGAVRLSEAAKQVEIMAHDVVEGIEFDDDKITQLFIELKEAYFAAEPELKALMRLV